MNDLDAIKEAIRSRAPITFRYIRDGKTPDPRKGDPHAVFIMRLKSGEEHVYAHIVQTDGATDSGQALPSWRQFFMNDVSVDTVHKDEAPFDIHGDYNPTYYEFPIEKV